MKFFQHFLPGTPLEENNHRSMGVVFRQIFRSRILIIFVRGLQIDIAKPNLTETQKDALLQAPLSTMQPDQKVNIMTMKLIPLFMHSLEE